jgi:AhpD family alkylhydroperoxidase
MKPTAAEESTAMAKARIDMDDTAPETYRALSAVEACVRRSGLDNSLIELVKMRASQINGCAFCLDMHSRDAMRHGETAQRLFLLDAWRESPLYSERERAALAWTECLTRVATEGAPDSVFQALRPHFNDTEIANLTTLIGMINLWNRLAIGFHRPHAVTP